MLHLSNERKYSVLSAIRKPSQGDQRDGLITGAKFRQARETQFETKASHAARFKECRELNDPSMA
jgi:hypothetical protein